VIAFLQMDNGIQMSFVICLTFICGVIASLHISSNVHRRFEPNQIKTKAMRLVFYCFPAKHAVYKGNIKITGLRTVFQKESQNS
jgi:hypothetical protein